MNDNALKIDIVLRKLLQRYRMFLRNLSVELSIPLNHLIQLYPRDYAKKA